MYVSNINVEINVEIIRSIRRNVFRYYYTTNISTIKIGVHLAAKKASFTDHQFSHTRIAVGC